MMGAVARSETTKNIAARNARRQTKETSPELPANADIRDVVNFLNCRKQKRLLSGFRGKPFLFYAFARGASLAAMKR